MRVLVLAAALGLLAAPLALSVPASAFGWCTAVGPSGHECRSHLACIGWSWDSRGERCTIGVPLDLCRILCTIGPPLP
ncbi:MAG TPA: hypothetical protein VNX21_00805, partial [Candidatus Thermoplasmatota archaeon]|nr:hypothetical protein [Candidatus Thermoplasmatota archaeon]